MKIRSIRLRNNYKRFHDLTIDLGNDPKKIVALVGPNGSGKSSVFDGMLYLQNAYQRIGAFSAKEKDFHSMTGTNISNEDITIVFDTGESIGQIRARKNSDGKANTVFSLRNSYRYHSNLDIKEIKALNPIETNQIGASTSVDLDDKITDNYQRVYIHINKIFKHADITFKQAKEIVLGELNNILSNCLGLTISDTGDIQDGKGTLYFTKDDQTSAFGFNVLSSGEKEVVDILLDIFLKRTEYNDTIYIIDEPELHLNTGIQKKLLIEIERLIPDTCQLWVATHSLGFLNALQNELKDKSDVINFEGDLSQATKTLVPMKKSRENWQKVFKTALEDLTGLIAPSIIIYCEGRHDPGPAGEEQGLDADIYNTIFSEAHPESLFVSSGGQTNPDKYAAIALKVLNKAFKDARILLLKDKDINGNGQLTTDEQRQQFLQSDTMNRMLARKEIENYLFDFEIVSKTFPEIQRENYENIIPDISAGDVKEKAGPLLHALNIHTGMNRDGLKRKLAEFVTPETQIYRELYDIIF